MTMVSDFPTPVGDDGALMSEKHIGRPERSQRRVPKKVHKAEREKLKREHLNDLFLELGQALEPGRHNNGKASVLGDAARLLRDMLSQVESLRRENTSLATESQFVAMEKSELRDENLALEQEIRKLQEELKEKGRSKPAWRGGAEVAPPQPSTAAAVVGPVYVIPINQELAAYSTEAAAPPPPPGSPPKPPSQVTRPHARYPTPADSWPEQILALQLGPAAQDGQHSGGGGGGDGSDSSTSSSSSSGGGGGRTEAC